MIQLNLKQNVSLKIVENVVERQSAEQKLKKKNNSFERHLFENCRIVIVCIILQLDAVSRMRIMGDDIEFGRQKK